MNEDFPPGIVQAAATGDRARQEILLEAAWPHAFRIAKSILRDDTLAEDAAQEACARALGSIKTLRNSGSFRAWFVRLVVRQSLSDLKKSQMITDLRSQTGDPTDSYVTTLDVRAALLALPVRLRIPMVLHHYCDLSSREIGYIVGAPGATIRFRLAEARRSMQRTLRENDNHMARTKEALQ